MDHDEFIGDPKDDIDYRLSAVLDEAPSWFALPMVADALGVSTDYLRQRAENNNSVQVFEPSRDDVMTRVASRLFDDLEKPSY